MSNTILEEWHFTATKNATELVIPDGCCDLIVKVSIGVNPSWFLTEIDDSARMVSINAGDRLRGFRLAPGTQVEQTRLIKLVENRDPDCGEIAGYLHDCSERSAAIIESLEALSNSASVGEAARQIGVGLRTLQRAVSGQTGKPPAFWLQLARVRHAARAAGSGNSLLCVAHDCGYSDQAHMTREFRRWFGATPAQFASNDELQQSVCAIGYG